MKSLTKNKNASKTLKKKQQKHINDEVDFNSLALPGPPLTPEQFREAILSIDENGPSISLEEAKALWAKRKKELLKLVK